MIADIKQSTGVSREPDGFGIVAIVRDQATLDCIQGVTRELQLDDELSVEGTLDAALGRIRNGLRPRVLVLDLRESLAPIADVSAARAVGGIGLKLLALGAVNDVEFFRDLRAAGVTEYLVVPPSREALHAVLQNHGARHGVAGGLGQVIAFMGSRGGIGATTAAVSSAWVMSEDRHERTALLDLDLYFGTVALNLDADPGNGLREALEEPSRIDSLFIERAMVKVSDNLRILAAEAPLSEPLIVSVGGIDALLYELRRKFAWIVVDLPLLVTPIQRVILAAASHAVILSELSLAGLRDTIRLRTLVTEQAPRAQLFLIEAGSHRDRATVDKNEFEKAVGAPFDISLTDDAKGVNAAANAGRPVPSVAPHSAYAEEIHRLVTAVVGVPEAQERRRFGGGWRW